MIRYTVALANNYIRYRPVLVPVLMMITCGVVAFPLSFVSKTNLLMGLALFPFTILVTGKKRLSYLYLVAIALSILIACACNIRTFYFFGLGFYILFILELRLGRLNSIILFLLVFMSPFFEQIAVTLGFPIRLQLSELGASIMSTAGFNVVADGNMILMNGASFSVDEVCMGLNMLSISMLGGVYLIGFQFRQSGLQLSFPALSMYFLGIFSFSILSNLLRIVFIVVFQLDADHPMHEVTGLFCMLLYVLVPGYFLAKWMLAGFGNAALPASEDHQPGRLIEFFTVGLGIIILLAGLQLRQVRKNMEIPHTNVSLPGFEQTKLDNGITKLFNEEILVYVKYIPEFFSSDHTPLMCWKGAGFDLEMIREENVAQTPVYMARLIKSDETLYTAWWYTNGKIHTIDQLDWRSRMFMGEAAFCLVNITAANHGSLMKRLERIFTEHALVIKH